MKLSVPVTTSTMRLRVLGRLKQEEVESQAVEETLVHVHTEQHEAIVNSFWYVNFVAMFFSQHVGATRGYVHPETEADVGHCVG